MTADNHASPSLKVGDVVHLKSGGATMTVCNVGDVGPDGVPIPNIMRWVRCAWHSAETHPHSVDYPPEALVMYKPDTYVHPPSDENAFGVPADASTDWRRKRGLS